MEAAKENADQLTERVKDRAADLKRQAREAVQDMGVRARSAAYEQKNVAAERERVGMVLQCLERIFGPAKHASEPCQDLLLFEPLAPRRIVDATNVRNHGEVAQAQNPARTALSLVHDHPTLSRESRSRVRRAPQTSPLLVPARRQAAAPAAPASCPDSSLPARIASTMSGASSASRRIRLL
jgi:hypothetical protein